MAKLYFVNGRIFYDDSNRLTFVNGRIVQGVGSDAGGTSVTATSDSLTLTPFDATVTTLGHPSVPWMSFF